MVKRGKGKKNTEVSTNEFYSQYADDTFRYKPEGRIRGTIDKTSEYYMSKQDFVKVLKSLMFKITQAIIYNSFVWKIPYYLGRLVILKHKARCKELPNGDIEVKLPVDYKKTKELGKVVYNFNQHSDGNVMKIIHKRSYVKIPYKNIIIFTACRSFKRRLAHAIKTDPNIDYQERNAKR